MITIQSVKRIKICCRTLQRSYSNTSELSYIHNIGKHPLVYRTIGQELARVASECGDREAFVSCEEHKRLTFDQVKSEADRLAAGFRVLGLGRGDRVGMWAPNVISWPVVMFAAARAGLILVALNPAYEAQEMEFCLRKVGIKALVTSESFRSKDYYEKLLEIVPELEKSSGGEIQSQKLPSLSSIIIDSEKSFPGAHRLTDVMSLPTTTQIGEIDNLQRDITPDTGCNIQFTSGTTGTPKATLVSHFALVNQGLNSRKLEIAEKRLCVQIPLFHSYGTSVGIMAGLSHCATIVLPSTYYSPEKSLRAIRDEECSVIHGTPTMYVDLVNKQREMKLDLKAEIAVAGGAFYSSKLFQEMKKELGLKKVKNNLGMTESSGAIFHTLDSDTDEQIQETVGHVQDHIEVKVIDGEGNIVPFGTAGELCVRGYFTMLGYWGDEEKTRETLVDGWLRTGDQFVLQADGYGRIVGRLKEMIIRGGENIFPKEIENFLATCPEIAEAHIVGVPDERLGEEMCAFVRLRDANALTPDAIRQFCKGKISFFKIPRYIEIVEEFPKTLSGKIQKFKLQQQFKEKFSKK